MKDVLLKQSLDVTLFKAVLDKIDVHVSLEMWQYHLSAQLKW